MATELKNILFIDIETVSAFEDIELLPERFKPLWEKKALHLRLENQPLSESYFEKAAIYAEFGKIIVIGLGYVYQNEEKEWCLKVKSISSKDEKELLNEFCELINKKTNINQLKLCAHNGREFDFPYICRRLLVNNIPIPKVLDVRELKPWDIPHYDTMDMWRFGDKKAYTSLELLAACLDVPTSKVGLDGSKVNETYYKKNDLEAIVEYCKLDVATLANVFLKLIGKNIIQDKNTIFTP